MVLVSLIQQLLIGYCLFALQQQPLFSNSRHSRILARLIDSLLPLQSQPNLGF